MGWLRRAAQCEAFSDRPETSRWSISHSASAAGSVSAMTFQWGADRLRYEDKVESHLFSSRYFAQT